MKGKKKENKSLSKFLRRFPPMRRVGGRRAEAACDQQKALTSPLLPAVDPTRVSHPATPATGDASEEHRRRDGEGEMGVRRVLRLEGGLRRKG